MTINVGYSGIKDGALLYSIPKNGTIKAKVLVNSTGIITGDICTHKEMMWGYTGPEDPIHKVNGQPRWMAIVPVTAKIGAEKKDLLLRLPKTAIDQLISFEGETGLRGRIFTITRHDGDGKSFVRYTIVDTKSTSSVDKTEKEIVDWAMSKFIQGDRDQIATAIGATGKTIHEEEDL